MRFMSYMYPLLKTTSILVMMTSFTRIVVVLSLLRTAMGTQQTPPSQVLVSLALFLTLFIMMPTFQATYNDAVQPLLDGTIDEAQALNRAAVPFENFMMSHVRERDLALFVGGWFAGRLFSRRDN